MRKQFHQQRLSPVEVPAHLQFMYAPEVLHQGNLPSKVAKEAEDAVEALSKAQTVLAELGKLTAALDIHRQNGSSQARRFLELLSIQVNNLGAEAQKPVPVHLPPVEIARCDQPPDGIHDIWFRGVLITKETQIAAHTSRFGEVD